MPLFAAGVSLQHNKTEFELDPEESLATYIQICNCPTLSFSPTPKADVCDKSCTGEVTVHGEELQPSPLLNLTILIETGYIINQYNTASPEDCERLTMTFYNNRALNLSSIRINVPITINRDRSNPIRTYFNVIFRERKSQIDCPTPSPSPNPTPIPCTESPGVVQASTTAGVAAGSVVITVIIAILIIVCIVNTMRRRTAQDAQAIGSQAIGLPANGANGQARELGTITGNDGNLW